MRRNQIRSSSVTDESIYIGGVVSSVEYWLSWSAGRGRTIVVTLDGPFRIKLKSNWLPTPFASFPFTSPPVRRRVPPVSVSTIPPLCRVFTIIYLKQTMFPGYMVLQLFCIYNLCYMLCYFAH